MTVTAITVAEYNARAARQQAEADWLTVTRVCRELGYNPEAIRGPHRDLENVTPRRVVAKALRDLGWSYPRIGRGIGGRNHATIMALLGKTKRGRERLDRLATAAEAGK